MQILSQAYVSLPLSLLLRHQNEESSFLFQSIQYIFFSRKSDSDYNAEDATIIFDKNQFVMLCSCNLFILEPDISQVANVYLTGCGQMFFCNLAIIQPKPPISHEECSVCGFRISS